jgi:hypothetical protein
VPSYSLHVKIDGQWQRFMTFATDDPMQAFRAAMVTLPREHYGRPFRLEQEEETDPVPAPPPRVTEQP